MCPQTRLTRFGLIAFLIALMTAATPLQTSAAEPTENLAAAKSQTTVAKAASSSPRFYTTSTIVRIGQRRAIPFSISSSAADDKSFEVISSDAQILRVASTTKVISGQTIGHVLVEPVAEGEAELRIKDQTIRVQVKRSEYAAEPQLRIVSPTQHAFIWGEIAVAVECDIALAESTRLVLPDGIQLEPDAQLSQRSAATARMVFNLDASSLSNGPHQLLAVATADDRTIIKSDPHPIHIVDPNKQELFAGECEDFLDGPRPAEFGDGIPNVGSQPSASGGGFVINAGARPAWSLAKNIAKAGQYQMIVRARGDEGGGVLPSIALYLGDSDDVPLTGGRLAAKSWHRVPVGRPVQLPAGDVMLTVYFTNDFYVQGMTDRNLFLDSFELMRVGDGDIPDPTASTGNGMSMMSSASLPPMAMSSGGITMSATTQPTTQPANEPGNVSPGVTPEGFLSPNLMVAFEKVFDGKPVTGLVEIEGFCHWPDSRNASPPTVDLLINGRSVASHIDGKPYFQVDRANFEPGENAVQLLATLPNGHRSWTPAQRLYVPGEVDEEDKPRRVVRFTALDPHWGTTLEKQLTDRERIEGCKVAHFPSNATATLQLPDSLEGDFDLKLHGRADEFKGLPIARITIEAEGSDPVVIERQVWGWWNLRDFGRVQLPAGPKKLHLAFVNDEYEEGVGDRNLWVWALQFVERDNRVDRTAPKVSLQYPTTGDEGFGADVVVAQAFDDTSIANVDLLIDGKGQNIEEKPGDGVGRFILPLLLRDLPAGDHEICVRAIDDEGNVGLSETITYRVLDRQPKKPTKYAAAIHLLNRFAFGCEPDEIADVLTMGSQSYLLERLSRSSSTAGERSAMAAAFTRHREYHTYAITQRATTQLLMSDNPVRCRFLLWAQNHFSTWAGKTDGAPKWDEHRRFYELGAAPFGDLLWASATSPAMLHYLDQHQSYAGRINENYARELLELHTLGVNAGYSQEDVTALAKLLTGWTIVQEVAASGDADTRNRRGYSFHFAPSLNESSAVDVFTLALHEPKSDTEQYERITDLLAALATHPRTAAFISRKLAEHYVGTPAPQALVDDLTHDFLATSGDMRHLLLTIAGHESFEDAIGQPKVCTPIDYAFRISRTAEASNDWAVREVALRSGAGLFDCSTPDGYPEEDDQYATNNSMIQRWQFAKRMEWSLIRAVPEPWRNIKIPNDAWRQRAVDAAAIRITGNVLSKDSNEAALNLLKSTELNDHRRMLLLTTFVAQLPEANLR